MKNVNTDNALRASEIPAGVSGTSAVVKNVMKINFPLAVKAVVIDLDGTLLHTAPDLADADRKSVV